MMVLLVMMVIMLILGFGTYKREQRHRFFCAGEEDGHCCFNQRVAA